MKVTPIKKKFGKYAPGDVFTLPDKTAKIFIKANRLEQSEGVVSPAPALGAYQTRMLQAAPVSVGGLPDADALATAADGKLTTTEAPYGYKADGTPRARPGRPAKIA